MKVFWLNTEQLQFHFAPQLQEKIFNYFQTIMSFFYLVFKCAKLKKKISESIQILLWVNCLKNTVLQCLVLYGTYNFTYGLAEKKKSKPNLDGLLLH